MQVGGTTVKFCRRLKGVALLVAHPDRRLLVHRGRMQVYPPGFDVPVQRGPRGQLPAFDGIARPHPRQLNRLGTDPITTRQLVPPRAQLVRAAMSRFRADGGSGPPDTGRGIARHGAPIVCRSAVMAVHSVTGEAINVLVSLPCPPGLGQHGNPYGDVTTSEGAYSQRLPVLLTAKIGYSPAVKLGLPDAIRACLFDLDGVLTDTASVHRKAWKAMFDDFLGQRAEHDGTPFVPFDVDADYRDYVDGKTREDGVRSFLASRGIELPEAGAGTTVTSLGDRKNDMFLQSVHADGVKVFDGSRRYLKAVCEAGLAVAVVSSSANTREVLHVTGLDQYVHQRVDGVTLRDKHIKGKPAPDSYLEGARVLGATAAESAVFEDALSGVEAGRAGHFGIVVGVDRVGQADALRTHGADVVVTDLAELLTER